MEIPLVGPLARRRGWFYVMAWPSSCEHGQCGTCSVIINGKPVLACDSLVENAVRYFKTKEFHIASLSVAPVFRDLIIDMSKANKNVNKAKPWIIKMADKPEAGNEYHITPNDIEPTRMPPAVSTVFAVLKPACQTGEHFLGRMQ